MSAAEQVSSGRIISFYSFKGGVGRTMALANVAFLAAMNGLKILVMDWDLEAPGLHYYFRGILEPGEMNELKSARGVLDLAWEWRNKVDSASNADEVDALFAKFRDGEPFEAYVRSLYRGDTFKNRGPIDMITAGADRINIPKEVTYEEALAAFSWNAFLDDYAGGGMLDALRTWASHNYDLVLVDSRTGLADVAGICTMQLPDAVVLAFVLNRQNIDGVARIAGAIRANRGDAITIWPVPMRVSREGTAEEADASARALRELVRTGGLDPDSVERDMRGLLIKAEPNVPFMESLSAFNETDAALDPMTANFARLTKEITGVPISVPEIEEHWRDVVSSRLAPALSTESYLRQLMSGEPARAARELHQYVESAISALADEDEVPAAYVTALAETSFAMQQRGELFDASEEYDTPSRLTLLLRRLYERDHERWRSLLIDALQSTLDSDISFLDPEDAIVSLEEIDELLAADDESVEVLLRRGATRQRAARFYSDLGERVQQLAAADDALIYLSKARRLPGGDSDEVMIARCEAMLVKAEAYRQIGQSEESADLLRKAMKLVNDVAAEELRSDVGRIAFEASYWLMTYAREHQENLREASKFALIALARGQAHSPLFLSRLPEIADAVLAAPSPASGALKVLRKILVGSASPIPFAQFFGRAPRAASRFIRVLTDLLRSAESRLRGSEKNSFTTLSVELVRAVLHSTENRLAAARHRRYSPSARQSIMLIPPVLESIERFVDEARLMGVGGDVQIAIDELADFAQALQSLVEAEAADPRHNRVQKPE